MADSLIGAAHVWPNARYQGRGHISGEPSESPATGVYQLDQPISRRVTVWHRRTLTPLYQTLSGVDGSFRVAGLRDDEYFVTAWDILRAHNAVIQDFVHPAFD